MDRVGEKEAMIGGRRESRGQMDRVGEKEAKIGGEEKAGDRCIEWERRKQ